VSNDWRIIVWQSARRFGGRVARGGGVRVVALVFVLRVVLVVARD
jgi:hypothetical protein